VNKVLEKLAKRKEAKEAAASGTKAKETTKLSVVVDVADTDEDVLVGASGINPPEGEGLPEPPDDSEKPARGKAAGKAPAKARATKQASEGASDVVPGVFMRALEAAWDVLATDIARRVKELK
jgi:hypothetical protein